MIILEGPDGSGKTTLAQRLRRTTGMIVNHSGGPPDSLSDINSRYKVQLKSFGTIWDRNICISELVYGHVLHRRFLDDEQLYLMLSRFKDKIWMIIFCNPSLETIMNHAENKLWKASIKKDHKSEDHIIELQNNMHDIYFRYQCVMKTVNRMRITVLEYDRDKQS